mmetsp:Transcript_40693/g.80190  ORF Transcript_40693/g.80190 Transcript_40693/m.80190 type:complete len:276 (-) Transcript_40693:603-1430(-)
MNSSASTHAQQETRTPAEWSHTSPQLGPGLKLNACMHASTAKFHYLVPWRHRHLDDLDLLGERADVAQVLARFLHPGSHRFLGLSQPHTGVVELLVRLVLSIGIPDLTLEVPLVLFVELPQTVPVGPLEVGVHVHLHHPCLHCSGDLLLCGPRTSMEDEEARLAVCSHAELLGNKILVLSQNAGVQLHVARLVHTVHISECCCDGKVRCDLRQGLVDSPDLGALGVQLRLVCVSVVHTVLLASRDPDFHLEENLHGSHLLEVGLAGTDVLGVCLF